MRHGLVDRLRLPNVIRIALPDAGRPIHRNVLCGIYEPVSAKGLRGSEVWSLRCGFIPPVALPPDSRSQLSAPESEQQ
jgi:hypothetical protein